MARIAHAREAPSRTVDRPAFLIYHCAVQPDKDID
jgi:hypothetical protein